MHVNVVVFRWPLSWPPALPTAQPLCFNSQTYTCGKASPSLLPRASLCLCALNSTAAFSFCLLSPIATRCLLAVPWVMFMNGIDTLVANGVRFKAGWPAHSISSVFNMRNSQQALSHALHVVLTSFWFAPNMHR